jgi:hypothetical protein
VARSLHYFFKRNNLRCIHWDNDNLARVMEENFAKADGRRALEGGATIDDKVSSPGPYEAAHVFSDLRFRLRSKDAQYYYKRLDADYPGSKFILNVGQTDDWTDSR